MQVCHHTREGFGCNGHHLHHQSPGLGHVEIKGRPLSPHLWVHNFQPVGQDRRGPRLSWQATAWAGAGRAPRVCEVCACLCVCARNAPFAHVCVGGVGWGVECPFCPCVYGEVCVRNAPFTCVVCVCACECVRNAPVTPHLPAARSCLRRLVAQCIG